MKLSTAKTLVRIIRSLFSVKETSDKLVAHQKNLIESQREALLGRDKMISIQKRLLEISKQEIAILEDNLSSANAFIEKVKTLSSV